MSNFIKTYLDSLQPREKLILGIGTLFVALLLIYQFVWMPWHSAISYMEESVANHRENLVWLRQQSELLAQNGSSVAIQAPKGAGESLQSLITQTAGSSGVSQAIQQLTPRQNNTQVSVVLEAVSFNKWVRWADSLQSTYGVSILQLSAERDDDKPDIADIRVTFERK